MLDLPTGERMIRSCGGGYQYCDGECTTCSLANTTYSTTTSQIDIPIATKAPADILEKPTRAPYDESKQAKNDLSRWIRLSQERQRALMDDLLQERTNEKTYVASYEMHRDIVRRYEIYEEICANE